MALETLAILTLLAAPADDYAGSRACAPCHKAIYDSYRQTPMGRSMSAVTAISEPAPASVASPDGKREFRVVREGARLFQMESEPGVFEAKHALSYAIGSGENGKSYAVRIADHLFQAPLSRYSKAAKKGAWDLSPGYELADYGFSRPILPACIACHSGRPQPIAGRQGRFQNPPFRELAIGCENCHGPGGAHIRRRDPQAIVNPARLEPRLAENICMNCHQGGDARVLQPGKDLFDFRPGQWLNETLIIAKLPASLADDDLLEHHSAMEMSKCFKESGGKLGCLTCHDVHRKETVAAASNAAFRKKCLSCHAPTSCKTPARERAANNGDNCVACHMPKREVATISHSALTNHRIIRRAGQPLPPGDTSQLVRILNAPAGPLPKLTELRIFGELADREPKLREPYLKLLDQLALEHPEQGIVQAALGRRALLGGDVSKAVAHLERAASLGYDVHTLAEDTAEAHAKSARLADAVDVLNAALLRDPYIPTLHKSLVLRLIGLKRYDEARAAMQRYLEIFPHDSFMRGLLAKVAPQ